MKRLPMFLLTLTTLALPGSASVRAGPFSQGAPTTHGGTPRRGRRDLGPSARERGRGEASRLPRRQGELQRHRLVAQGRRLEEPSPSPNVNTRYMYFFINTKQDGPVVVELPPAVPGASFYGTIEDAWYLPLIDVGFEGKGGEYLVLPPDYKGDVPDGYTAVRPPTYNTMTLLRSILAYFPKKMCRRAMRCEAGQSLSLVESRQPTRAAFLDMTDVIYNGLFNLTRPSFTPRPPGE